MDVIFLKLIIRCPAPMGWNSWNSWAGNVDQEKVLRSARATHVPKVDPM